MPCNATANAAQQAWEQGNAACLHGDFDLAIRHYNEAIAARPEICQSVLFPGQRL